LKDPTVDIGSTLLVVKIELHPADESYSVYTSLSVTGCFEGGKETA